MPQLIVFYEAWYTKALNIVRNLIPNRLENIVSAYEQNRIAPPTFSNYSIREYFLRTKVKKSSIAESIRIQCLIPTAEACLDPEKRPPSKQGIELMINNVRKVIGTVS